MTFQTSFISPFPLNEQYILLTFIWPLQLFFGCLNRKSIQKKGIFAILFYKDKMILMPRLYDMHAKHIMRTCPTKQCGTKLIMVHAWTLNELLTWLNYIYQKDPVCTSIFQLQPCLRAETSDTENRTCLIFIWYNTYQKHRESTYIVYCLY